MYGIIPAASPSDQSYGLTLREVVPGRSDGTDSFAEQLSRVNSRAADQRLADEKQRHGGETATSRSERDGDASKASDATRADKANRAEEANHDQEANRDQEAKRHTADAAAEKADGRERAAEQADRAESESLRKKKAADRAEQTVQALTPALVEAKLHKETQVAGSGDDMDLVSKAALHVAQSMSDGADTPHTDQASADQVSAEKSTGEKTAKKATAVGGKAAAFTDAGKNSAAAKEAKTAAKEQANANDLARAADETERASKSKAEKGSGDPAEEAAEKPGRAQSLSGETLHAENLVDPKGESKDADSNRRLRDGDDPREGRLAAKKVGTKTVEAKAVSPAETENTTTERTAARELMVDLSEGSAQQRDTGDGTETSLSTSRIEVALGEGSSRSPSVSQATQTLARRLNGELGDNIVRQAKVMLQDANTAELRLVIRPPELGRIRIRLQMENGHIAGRILVDNGSVREVVEQNLASLQRAFEEAGLEMGDLEVSTGDARDDAQQGEQDQGGSGQRVTTAGVESFGRNIETISEYEPGRHRINLVA